MPRSWRISKPPRSRASGLRARLFVFLVLASFCTVRPHPVSAASFVDRRVTALSAATLLGSPGYRLVDGRRQHAAQRLRTYTRPLFFVAALSQILALLYFWASGLGARLRDALRRTRAPLFAMRFTYGALVALIAAFVSLPAALARYRVDVAFGLSNQSALNWARDGIIGAALQAIVVGLVVACIFALVDRTRLWYAYGIGGLFIVTLLMAFLEPVVVAPLYNHFSPLPRTAAARAPLAALARSAGIGSAPILVTNSLTRSSAAIAKVSGFGPTKRIVLSDALLRAATTAEVVFLTAREFGHYAHGDTFRLSLFWTFLFVLCTALAVVLADRIAFRRDDDPLARLSLVLAFLGLLGLAVAPIYNAYSRNLEAQADGYALALTRDRASAVRAFVRISDETLSSLCPSRADRLYFYNSVPFGTRVAKATGRTDPCR